MSGATASFYFDLANPLAYFAAEQVLQVLPGAAEWQPVLARKLPVAERFEGWRCEQDLEVAIAELARRAGELGLQPLRLPAQFPFDSELAMRVATYAKSIGRTVPYAQAAYRQAFAGGRDLAEPDNVVIAAAACEMHPAAVLRGAKLRSVGEQLVSATAQAFDAGVRDVPAVRVGDRVFHGERSLGEAAAAIAIGGDRSDAGRVASTPGGARADFRLDVIEEGR